MEHERQIQALHITVTILLFVVGCIAGKLIMIYASDIWPAFNGTAIGILGIGELIWLRIRKKLTKKWEED